MFKGVILMISMNLLLPKRSILDAVHSPSSLDIISGNGEVFVVFENVVLC